MNGGKSGLIVFPASAAEEYVLESPFGLIRPILPHISRLHGLKRLRTRMTQDKILEAVDEELTGEEQLFLNLGPYLLEGSLDAGNKYATTVIPTSSGLITVYIGLLKWILGEGAALTNFPFAFIVFSLPPILFIISLIAAIRLLQPNIHFSSPASSDSLHQVYNEIVKSKERMSNYTTAALVLGLVIMIFALLAAMVIASAVSGSS